MGRSKPGTQAFPFDSYTMEEGEVSE